MIFLMKNKSPLMYEMSTETFQSVIRVREKHTFVFSDYMKNQPNITKKMRTDVIVFLIDVHYCLGCQSETLFRAINIMDRFLAKKKIDKSEFYLVGLVSFFIATKLEEDIIPIKISGLVEITNNLYTKKEIVQVEAIIANSLEFDFNSPTPYDFIGEEIHADNDIMTLVSYVLEMTLINYDLAWIYTGALRRGSSNEYTLC